MKKTLSTKAFTLIELLIVIAIIAILAAAVIIAVNPGEQLAKARDATRERHVNAVESAVYTYHIDNLEFPSDLANSLGSEICNTNITPSNECGDLIDLSPLVEEGYLPQIPINPTTEKNTSSTGYSIATIEDKVAVWPMESETRVIGQRPALGFNGVDDYVNHEIFNFTEDDSWSWGAWIYFEEQSISPQYIFMTHQGSHGICFMVNHNYRFAFRTTHPDHNYIQWSSDSIVPYFEKWSYVLFVSTGDTLTLYINGKKFEETKNFPIRGRHSGIAYGNLSYPYMFKGRTDDVRIYNRALSESEIQSLYKGQNITDGLVGHWPLSEGQGCTVYDHSGNNNHGTLEPNCPEEGPGWVIGR